MADFMLLAVAFFAVLGALAVGFLLGVVAGQRGNARFGRSDDDAADWWKGGK